MDHESTHIISNSQLHKIRSYIDIQSFTFIRANSYRLKGIRQTQSVKRKRTYCVSHIFVTRPLIGSASTHYMYVSRMCQ